MSGRRPTLLKVDRKTFGLVWLISVLWLPGWGVANAAGLVRADQNLYHNSRQILPFLQRMVAMCEAKGWYGSALTYQARLLVGLTGHWGGNHPQVLRERTRKARLLLMDGRLKEGEAALETIEKDFLRLLGEHHVETAMVRLNRAQLAMYLPGGAGDALRWVDAAIPVLERSLWPDHPHLIEAMMVRGRALSALVREGEAEKVFVDLLGRCVTNLGPLDRSVAETLSEMGWNRIRMGRYQDGVVDLERGLAIFERDGQSMAFNNRMTLLGRLAEGYLRRGKRTRAYSVLEKILAEMDEKQGSNHKALAKPLTDLGMVELELGWLERSEAHLKRALALVQNGDALRSLQVAFILTNLGDLFGRQGKNNEQERYFTEAQSSAETFFAEDSVGLANWLASMAIILHQGGHQKRSEALFSRSLQLLEAALGKDDPAVVGVRESLSRLSKSGVGKEGEGAKGLPVVAVEPFGDGGNESGSGLSQRRRSLMDAFKLPPGPSGERLVVSGDDPYHDVAAMGTGGGDGVVSLVGQTREKNSVTNHGIEGGVADSTESSVVPKTDDRAIPEPLPRKSHVALEQGKGAGEARKDVAVDNVAPEPSGWIVHLACWKVMTQDSKQVLRAVETLGVSVYQRSVRSNMGSVLCFYSGPYSQRQEAVMTARMVGQKVTLTELRIEKYWNP